MIDQKYSNRLAFIIAVVCTTTPAFGQQFRNTICDVDGISPRDAVVLQTLAAPDFIDLIIDLQTIERFSAGIESNQLATRDVSNKNGVREVRVSCPGGGSITTKQLEYFLSHHEAVNIVENCVLHNKSYVGSYSVVNVPTKYYEIADLFMTSESSDGTSVSFSGASYVNEFSDHYFNAAYDGTKTYKFKEMKKSLPKGIDYGVSSFIATVEWGDRTSDKSKLRASFALNASASTAAIQVTTEKPVVVDGNTRDVSSGRLTLNDRTSDSTSDIRAESGWPERSAIDRTEIDFSNIDRAVNECISKSIPLRYNVF
ncbi:hypothetical protein ACUNV4_17965 [Granulosicoccus sp. 3-233]|uniref:hypothetical protein n=1 Tax=Granulosicoccus sp. 3-233 TaxID=3417969 RepID=UPI003D330DE4